VIWGIKEERFQIEVERKQCAKSPKPNTKGPRPLSTKRWIAH
jgi:hypothetical protein